MPLANRMATAGRPRIYPAVLGAAAGGLFVGGVKLLSVGGSAYYLIAGLLLATTAILLWRRSRWGLWSYGALLALSLVWALWEVGPDAWGLLPRLLFFAIVGFWLLLPWSRRSLTGGPNLRPIIGKAAQVTLVGAMILIAVVAIGRRDKALAISTPASAMGSPADAAGADWPVYGGNAGGTRFSLLEEITPANVKRVQRAWTYDFGNVPLGGLQVTPLKIGNSLFACTASNVVVAIDADNGKERWRYDPKIDPALMSSCRGVAYYHAADDEGACADRIFTVTLDARLIALDARTGRRCIAFGSAGEVSLKDDMPPTRPDLYRLTSAPTIARGRVIVGGTALALKGFNEPSGVIRAFDAVTGKLSWAYDVGQTARAAGQAGPEFYTPGTPNAWTSMAYDDALGLVYVPTGGPGASYYGADRRAIDDETSTSIMALDVETGQRRWIFQTVHHDLWDYDVGSQPLLIDMVAGNGSTRALIQPTKRGEIFLLDRATGKPIGRVVERKVPQGGAVPEERLSATQPFSVELPSLSGGLLTEQAMWGLTPFDQLWCRIKFREARYEGPMTPPGLTASIQYPGWLGGMNWGSASLDTDRNVLLTVTGHVANHVKMTSLKPTSRHARGKGGSYDLHAVLGQADVPYAASTIPFLSPLAVPCQQPPWSRLTAVDLRQRKILWSRPLGTGRDNGPFGIRSRLPLTIGAPALGGVLVTRAGLTFVGASSDHMFRAYETATGRLLWEAALPASGNATPITYRNSRGRQIVLIAAGGHNILGGATANALVAFELRPGR